MWFKHSSENLHFRILNSLQIYKKITTWQSILGFFFQLKCVVYFKLYAKRFGSQKRTESGLFLPNLSGNFRETAQKNDSVAKNAPNRAIFNRIGH